MCSSRVYTKKGKGARRKKARSVETKQKRRGCVRPFLVIFAVYWLESCVLVVPCFWSGWSWPTGFFKGCPQLEPVLFPYRTGLSTGTRCSISEQRQKKNGRRREREREKEGIPVLSAFGHFRWLTFSPEPINVFTQSSYGFWIFFFSINDSFLIIDNSSARSVKKISI